jgi:hypothetical protein
MRMDFNSQTKHMTRLQPQPARNSTHGPVFLFDFDGTQIDRVPARIGMAQGAPESRN